MSISIRLLLFFVTAWLTSLRVDAAETEFAPEQIEFFEKRVRPILANRCYECHSTAKAKKQGGLLLDDRAAILTGGDSGAAATPGEPDKSLLIEAVRYDPAGFQMPPTGKLPASEIATLAEWVKLGLPHPTAAATKTAKKEIDLAKGRQHWAFHPLREHSIPDETQLAGGNRIDWFLNAKREQHGLKASPAADARTLFRRASFDLLGLPSAEADLKQIPDGKPFDVQYAEYLDQLLASPHYGERWGRYWLDLTRYADIMEQWREGEGQPWRYRDWVVHSLNRDTPYDRFVQQQLAADLLPDAQPADFAGLGFLGLSPSYWKELKLDHQVIKQVVAEEWEEKLDAIGSTFLGLTIACARCHDHKFDPITTNDYYALAGVLASIREADRPLLAADQAAPALAARSQAKTLEAKIKPLAAKSKPTDEEQAELAKLQAELATAKQTPHFDLAIACGVVDAALHVLPNGQNATRLDYKPGVAQDVALHIRGNPARTAAVVPRRFLTVLSNESSQPFRQGSGRLELAQSITNEGGGLAARVMVNRVWKHHFGRGLVETPSNFGLQGSPPSHPELLDDLAARFVAHGWSLKWLHREIMTSAAYQQSSRRDPAQFAIDPDNQWLWRMTPRRLDVESWRDSLLLVAGELNENVGGPPLELDQATNHRRTVYGLVRRRELSELLRLFDFPDPVASSAQREPTITPLQQLFVLNSPFFEIQSRQLVEKVLTGSQSETGRLQVVYRRLFQREASLREVELGSQFVRQLRSGGASESEAWRQYAHVLLASNEFLFVD
ncbi:PSD1 and planctomycete cytochrome C domain-containing protein [Anatilimnocola floriformis]|uniref:PSD1 and planctomycete cytochrome C domain-containing protein n=1 Tax=Anatilimnocola floriformis TaxID=2948575 RepID=UPI0020C4270F|nr:PSD1 and planctomycete cytochrome C domain-containing protein [Anatilimnocola floriformis]